MFFVIGVSQGQKRLNFDQLVVCRSCGKYGHLEVYMVYSYLSLFFIPILKWGRSYYVKTTCCDRTVVLDTGLGRQIERGEVTALPEDIIPDSGQYGSFTGHKRCDNCGYETDEDFQYCPKCGGRL